MDEYIGKTFITLLLRHSGKYFLPTHNSLSILNASHLLKDDFNNRMQAMQALVWLLRSDINLQ